MERQHIFHKHIKNFIIMIDFNKITQNKEVIELLKQKEEIERKIFQLDENALINYELEKLSL
jgi:hypothetical protein